MRRFLLVAMLAPLAACNAGGPTVSATNASEAEVKAKVAEATGGADMISAGRWEGTMTISEMKMPKLPADQQAKLASKIGGTQPLVSCVTEEEVKAKRAFFTGDKGDKSCTYSRFNMSGGKIDAAMTCKNPGGNMDATMTGTFSPDSYHMQMASNTDSSSPYAAMSMKMTIDAKRTGVCRGTEDKE